MYGGRDVSFHVHDVRVFERGLPVAAVVVHEVLNQDQVVNGHVRQIMKQTVFNQDVHICIISHLPMAWEAEKNDRAQLKLLRISSVRSRDLDVPKGLETRAYDAGVFIKRVGVDRVTPGVTHTSSVVHELAILYCFVERPDINAASASAVVADGVGPKQRVVDQQREHVLFNATQRAFPCPLVHLAVDYQASTGGGVQVVEDTWMRTQQPALHVRDC
jgi:hypothetical protein